LLMLSMSGVSRLYHIARGQFSSFFNPFFKMTPGKKELTNQLNDLYAKRERVTKQKKSPISKLSKQKLVAKVNYN
jgi:hypothetical protein